MLTRRRFLQVSSLFALAPTVPLFVSRTAQAAAVDKDRCILVVVEMNGGNDALNTVVPYTDPTYEKLRPTLRIARKELLTLSASLGLHPSLKPLDKLWQAGQLAVLPGVGYPNPDRSHFESLAIWHTARFDPEEQKGYGWLGRALDPQAGTAYLLGNALPTALRGRRSTTIALNRVDEALLADPAAARQGIGTESADDLLAFIRRQSVDANNAADKLARISGKEDGNRYPATGLAERLKLAAHLIRSNLGARVFYTLQPGYDTHAVQTFEHGNLLQDFAGAVAAFFDDLSQAKLADRVTLLAFSEFGRTIKENGSAGTDHGTAGAVFLAGPSVRGGIPTAMPSLTDLVADEPKMTADFRGVYASVLRDWMGLPAKEILAGTFEHPRLFQR